MSDTRRKLIRRRQVIADVADRGYHAAAAGARDALDVHIRRDHPRKDTR